MNSDKAVSPLKKHGIKSAAVRALAGYNAQQADEAGEGEADGHAINQSKTDFLTKRIDWQQRP